MEENSKLRRFDNMVLLRSCPLFAVLAPTQLQRIVMLSKEKRFDKGETILDTGVPVTSLYIVKEGSCSYGEKLYIEGDVVLEYAIFIPEFLLDDKVVAQEDVIFLSIEQSDMYELLLNNPDTSVRLVERFAQVVSERE